jgi:hypothetical protein
MVGHVPDRSDKKTTGLSQRAFPTRLSFKHTDTMADIDPKDLPIPEKEFFDVPELLFRDIFVRHAYDLVRERHEDDELRGDAYVEFLELAVCVLAARTGELEDIIHDMNERTTQFDPAKG